MKRDALACACAFAPLAGSFGVHWCGCRPGLREVQRERERPRLQGMLPVSCGPLAQHVDLAAQATLPREQPQMRRDDPLPKPKSALAAEFDSLTLKTEA